MSQNHNQTSISSVDLANEPDRWIVIDVRKPTARLASGLAMPGAVWRHPFDAANWADAYRGMRVAVCCVHGHEVSQAVRGFMADTGNEAVIVEGGFEAWKAAGLPVTPVERADV